jgi:hypothetical protein
MQLHVQRNDNLFYDMCPFSSQSFINMVDFKPILAFIIQYKIYKMLTRGS